MTRSPSLAQGVRCPAPAQGANRVLMGHGSGGKMTASLLREHFLPHLDNAVLADLGDAAVVQVHGGHVAFSTDTFVVHPLEFPGGNIGSLAIHGTLNDLAMMGATPQYVSTGFILEEGLPLDLLDRVVAAMARAAAEAEVLVVTGDTKVVERGKADGLFINTAGMGVVCRLFAPDPASAHPGDSVILSGPVGRHGIAIMAAREHLAFDVDLESDTANLYPLVSRLRDAVGDAVHVLRDPTRGGVATALNEIAAASAIGVEIEESMLPVPEPVEGACEMLGLDPLYVANEGMFIAIVDHEATDAALEAMRNHPTGREAVQIGRIVARHPGLVAMNTSLGGTRVVDMLPGDQLPRIC